MAGNTGQKGHTIMKNQLVIVLDFGGQYNQLIARRVRECGVYCEVMRYTTPIAELAARNPVGIIFTGGPNSVYDPKSPHVDPAIFELGIPILGICYGCQLMAYTLGGTVASSEETREYGKTLTEYQTESLLFTGFAERSNLLDEPYRLYSEAAGRLFDYGTFCRLSGCSNGISRKEVLWRTVPSGSKSYRKWSADAA